MSAATRPDLATVAAIAIVAYALANVTHEGFGHGGMCVVTQCEPMLLTSMSFQGDREDAGTAHYWVPAGGSLANLVLGTAALLLLRRRAAAAPATWFFLWLLATINLLQAAGYLLFSGLGNIGDWAVVTRGLSPHALWRVLLAGAGGLAYWLITDRMLQMLARRLPGSGRERVGPAYRLTLPAYFTGAALYATAAALDPWGVVMLFISALPASLGGTSALAWGPQLLKDPRAGVPAGDPLLVARDGRWIAAAIVVAGLFIGVLGPGVAL